MDSEDLMADRQRRERERAKILKAMASAGQDSAGIRGEKEFPCEELLTPLCDAMKNNLELQALRIFRGKLSSSVVQQLALAFPPNFDELWLMNNEMIEGAFKALGDHFPPNVTNPGLYEQKLRDTDIASLLVLRPTNLTSLSIHNNAECEGVLRGLAHAMPPNLSLLRISG